MTDSPRLSDIIKDIPNFRERVLNILEIYQFDLSTTRKKNRYYSFVMWEIKRFIDKHYCDEVPIENGDLLDWVIGHMNFEKFK